LKYRIPHTPRKLHRHTVKNETLQQNRWFKLWAFHLYVATFQQHLHMEYLSLSWYATPEYWFLSGFPWHRVAAKKRSYWTKGSSLLTRSHHFESLTAEFVTRLTWWVLLVEQELLILPERLSSHKIFRGVRVTRSLVLYVCFVDICLSFCSFSFGHCVVCSSSIYEFSLPFWYL
jgi:hypothetical protein